VRYRVRALAVSALAVSLAVAGGCSKNTGGAGNTGGGGPQKQAAIIIDTKGDVGKAPAPDVPGAKKGGTLYWLEDGAPEHLRPQKAYVTDAQTILSLVQRNLTYYIEDPNGGPLKLVGDLATNAGESSNDSKTWTYHLRNGIKFEDGSPITSKDIAYAISSSTSKLGDEGPQYAQQALDPDKAFKFKVGDPTSIVPGITTPDDKTIVFNLKESHPEWPYVMALTTTSPVPAAKDTGEAYDRAWVSSGPYMQDGPYDAQTKLKLKKNPNWDPASDAIRHQYADNWVFDFSPNRADQTKRLIADQGADQYAVATQNVAQANVSEVQNDANLSKRVASAPTPFVDYVNINTSRVTDVKVRQALNYAFDRGAYITALGGSALAAPATALMAPTLPGYQKYDAYPGQGGDHGDPAKAKELLAGQKPKLKYCFANTATQQQYAVVIQQAMARADIQVLLAPIDKSAYYTTIGDKTTDCDIMRYGWGADFPDAQSTLNVLFNGKNIVAKGNQNTCYFNNPDINQKLDNLQKEPDRALAATKYGELDKEIMEKYAPTIPNFLQRGYLLHGSKVGGGFISPIFDEFNLVNLYAMS
jgi:peptide/nickel transport system substrate-binding protein